MNSIEGNRRQRGITLIGFIIVLVSRVLRLHGDGAGPGYASITAS